MSNPKTANFDLNNFSGIIFPVQIIGLSTSLFLSKSLELIPLDDPLKEKLLRVSKPTYDENGLLKSMGPTAHIISKYDISFLGPQNRSFYQSSNYGLVSSTREDALEFQLALKIFKDSWASIYLGFSLHNTHIVRPSYFGRQPFSLKEHEIAELSLLIKNIHSHRNNPKFKIISEKYLYANSQEILSESRFLELAIILEMIILPIQNSELIYRFSLRTAKIMNKIYGLDTAAFFDSAQEIYKTRSKIAHSGYSPKISAQENDLHNIVRHIVKAYVSDPSMFEDKNLDQMCLIS